MVTGATFGIIHLVSEHNKSEQRQQIARVTRDFVAALEENATTKAASCFCAPEAEYYLETNESDSAVDKDIAPSERGQSSADKLRVRDIVVRGDTASAIATNSLGDQKLYYRKEDGKWKLCDGAKPDFEQAAP